MKKLAMLLIVLSFVLMTGCQKEDSKPSVGTNEGGSSSVTVEKDKPQGSQEKEAEVLEREVYKGVFQDIYFDYPRYSEQHPEIRVETVGIRIRYESFSIVIGELVEDMVGRRDIDLSSLTLDESLPEKVGSFIDSMLGGGLRVTNQPVMSSRKSTFKSDEVDFITINGFDMMRISGMVTLPIAYADVDEVDAPFYSYFTFVDGEPFIAIMIGHDAQELDSEKAVLDDIMSTFRRWEESDNE